MTRFLLLRWAVTFLAFPLGGFVALPLTPVSNPWQAAIAGLVVGVVVGTAQWWALRRNVGRNWIAVTTVTMAIGNTLASAVTASSTSLLGVVAAALITGAVVGAGQGILLKRGRLAAAVWAGAVSLSWALGWVISAGVIDLDRGFAIFGSSGAVVVTITTGLALHVLLRMRPSELVANSTATLRTSVTGAIR
jgi:hypothetical protein